MRAVLLLGILSVGLARSDGYGYGGRPEQTVDAYVGAYAQGAGNSAEKDEKSDGKVAAEANANAQSSTSLNSGISFSGSSVDHTISLPGNAAGPSKQNEAGIAVSADVASGADALITLLNAAGEVAKNVAAKLKKQTELGGQVQLQAGGDQTVSYDAEAQANLASQLEKLAALEAAVGLSSGQGKFAGGADSDSSATVSSAGANVAAHEGSAQFGIGGGLGGLLGLELGLHGAHEHHASYSGQVNSNSNANTAVDGTTEGKLGLGLGAGFGGGSSLNAGHKGSVDFSGNAEGGGISSSGSLQANTGLHRVKLEKNFSTQGGLGLGLGVEVAGQNGQNVNTAAGQEGGGFISWGHNANNDAGVQVSANCGPDSCSLKPKGDRGRHGATSQGNFGLGATASAHANSGTSINGNSKHEIGESGSLDGSAGLGVELGVSVDDGKTIAKDSHGHQEANVGKVEGQSNGGYGSASAASSSAAASGTGSVNAGATTGLNGGLGIGLDIQGALEVLKTVANAVHASAHHSSTSGEAGVGLAVNGGHENSKAKVPSITITEHADGSVQVHSNAANGHEAKTSAEAGLGLGLGGGLGLGVDVGAKKTVSIEGEASANADGSAKGDVDSAVKMESPKSSTKPPPPAFHYNDGLGVGIDLNASKKVEKSGYGSASAGLGLGLGSVLSLG